MSTNIKRAVRLLDFRSGVVSRGQPGTWLERRRFSTASATAEHEVSELSARQQKWYRRYKNGCTFLSGLSFVFVVDVAKSRQDKRQAIQEAAAEKKLYEESAVALKQERERLATQLEQTSKDIARKLGVPKKHGVLHEELQAFVKMGGVAESADPKVAPSMV